MKRLVLALFLIGCSPKAVPVTEIKYVAEQKEPLDLKVDKPLSLEDVKFKVLYSDGGPYFCTTDQGYKAMSRNLIELTRYIMEQALILESYRKYYESDGK